MNGRSLDWLVACFPAGSIFGIRLGVHWTFPLVLLLYPVWVGHEFGALTGWALIVALVLLFGIVLLHELGHAFVAGREGSPAEEILLWPLGGLSRLGEELTGPAEVRLAVAGPTVNALLLLLLLPALALLSVRLGPTLFDPTWWDPIPTRSGPAGFLATVLYYTFKLNLAVLLLNLLPAFPLDGGRMVRGFLYRDHGPAGSVLATTTLSLILATALFVLAVVYGHPVIGFLAIFVGLRACIERRQAFAAATRPPPEKPGPFGYDFSMGHTSLDPGPEGSADPDLVRADRERIRREEEQEEARHIEEEVDRLLDKIHREGMESLSKKERSFLEKASRRKR